MHAFPGVYRTPIKVVDMSNQPECHNEGIRLSIVAITGFL